MNVATSQRFERALRMLEGAFGLGHPDIATGIGTAVTEPGQILQA